MSMAVAAMTANAQDTMNPLTVISGWQADVFCETGPVANYLKLGVDNGSVGFFTHTFKDYPITHPFTSETNPTSNFGHVYHIDATTNNALQLTNLTGDAFPATPVSDGIFTLKTAQSFSDLYLLATCGNGPATVDVIYTYSDASNSEEKITVLDWYNTTTDHSQDGFYGLDRIKRLDASSRSNITYVSLHEIKLKPTAGKEVTSIEFASETLNGKCICNLFGLSTGAAGVELEDGSYNVDLIAEAWDANKQVTGTTTSGIDRNGYVLYTDKVDFSNEKTYTYGVPNDGAITANSGTPFQLANYAGLNATRLAKDMNDANIQDMSETTILFKEKVMASELHMLAAAGNGTANVNVTYIYADGDEVSAANGDGINNNTGGYVGGASSTYNTTMDIMDWCNNHDYQTYTTGRYFNSPTDTNIAGFYEYVGTPDATKELVGVRLTNQFTTKAESKGIVVAFTAKGTVTGTTTGINTIGTAKTAADGKIFNLAGQQVSKSYKGIVIKNGQKMIQK